MEGAEECRHLNGPLLQGMNIASVFFLLVNSGFMMLFIAAYTTFVLSLFLLNPAFSPKSSKLVLNAIITVFVSIGLFSVSLMRVGVWSETIEELLYVQLSQTLLS